MISKAELRKLAKARLKDAQILLDAARYDGAIYMCGYVIEIGLKIRICKTLKWNGFPQTNSEFNNYKSFKTHDLEVLLSLSGIEEKVRTEFLDEWFFVNSWNPESRYNPMGGSSKQDAQNMVTSAEKPLKIM